MGISKARRHLFRRSGTVPRKNEIDLRVFTGSKKRGRMIFPMFKCGGAMKAGMYYSILAETMFIIFATGEVEFFNRGDGWVKASSTHLWTSFSNPSIRIWSFV